MTENIQNMETTSIIAEKRLERALLFSSVSTAIAVALLFLNVIFSLSLMQLSSKLKVIPYLVLDKPRASSEMVSREVVDRHMVSLKDICKIYIKRYIELREGYYNDERYIDSVLGYSPRGKLRLLANDASYSRIIANKDAYEKKKNTMKAASRKVIFEGIREFRKGKDGVNWSVEFKIAEMQSSMMSVEPKIIDMKSEILTISFYRNRRRNRGFFLNPLGIVVADSHGQK